jgi:hypothetical protein
MTDNIKLPPLPKASKMYDIPGYDEEELKGYARAAVLADRASRDPSPPVEIEEIMVNTPYNVFILPLWSSGLSSGPRFVVHVPGPEQPAADQFIATFRCEDNGIVGTTDAKIHSVTRHDDGRIEVVIDHWPKQPAVHPAITHCDNCGCDWLDNGLNPVGCPYCKQSTEIERLWVELEDWKESFCQAEAHAKHLAEALAGLITWIPSAATYRRLGFDPEAPMRALAEARAALAKEAGND